MKVAAADTAALNLDVDIVFIPLLGLEFAPLHVSVGRLLVMAQPAFELVIGHCCLYGLVRCGAV